MKEIKVGDLLEIDSEMLYIVVKVDGFRSSYYNLTTLRFDRDWNTHGVNSLINDPNSRWVLLT